MKSSLLGMALLFITAPAWGAPCKVYGISDGPQKLDCTFRDFSAALRCQNGTYFINNSKVQMAYHEEVEEGAVPLVFKALDLELIVLMGEKAKFEAEILTKSKRLTGKCE